MSTTQAQSKVNGHRKRKPGEPFGVRDLTDAQVERIAAADAICKPWSCMVYAHCPHHVNLLTDLLSVIRFGWDDKWTPRFVNGCRAMLNAWRDAGLTATEAEEWQLLVRDLVAIIEKDIAARPAKADGKHQGAQHGT